MSPSFFRKDYRPGEDEAFYKSDLSKINISPKTLSGTIIRIIEANKRDRLIELLFHLIRFSLLLK